MSFLFNFPEPADDASTDNLPNEAHDETTTKKPKITPDSKVVCGHKTAIDLEKTSSITAQFKDHGEDGTKGQSVSEDGGSEKRDGVETVIEDPEVANNAERFPVEIKAEDVKVKSDWTTTVYTIGDCTDIQCMAVPAMLQRIEDQEGGDNSAVTTALKQNTDLIPQVYEGGLKVWECALDLAEYLRTRVQFKGKTVLELGCGAGIPGILAMLMGAEQVHFQDYNREVLELYTVPNVMINRDGQKAINCRFFSGDWANFGESLKEEKFKYDIIITAETVYSLDNYSKLCSVFQEFLTDDGEIYVAGKSHYFGVGGGTTDFKDYVTKECVFDVITCHTVDEGLSRDILRLKKKPSSNQSNSSAENPSDSSTTIQTESSTVS